MLKWVLPILFEFWKNSLSHWNFLRKINQKCSFQWRKLSNYHQEEWIKDLDLLINEVYFLFSFGIRFIVRSFVIIFTIVSFFVRCFFFGNWSKFYPHKWKEQWQANRKKTLVEYVQVFFVMNRDWYNKIRSVVFF